MRTTAVLLAILLFRISAAGELTDEERRDRVEQKRREVQVIVHRGASTLARENTVAAYRIALELGADGNEIDIRATRDGVLVCFHDDMLDHHLAAFGDVSDYDWAELQKLHFRLPSRLTDEDRIPTLEEVFQLHRQHAGLMHLDIKRPGLEQPIIELLDRMDLWNQVVAANSDTAPAIVQHPKFRPGHYKGSLYADRAELDPAAIADVLARPGDMVIVDDPRGVLVELGRAIGRPQRSKLSADSAVSSTVPAERSEEELRRILADATDWDVLPENEQQGQAKATAILLRAAAAEEIRRRHLKSDTLIRALEIRAVKRSIHPQWMYHGLDGASALRALAELEAPRFCEIAGACLWRVDQRLDEFKDPRWKTPASWMDFRTKVIVFPLVEQYRIENAASMCQRYLDLSDEEADRMGPPQFETAARALLTIQPNETTAITLLKHRRGDVRGAAILMCLSSHFDGAATWGRSALQQAAPHALRYAIPD